MNVNDLVVQGAEPLFFLDCYSCSKLDVDTAATFIQGVANGCRQAGCALIGGETAEMPGLYSGTDYDVVGAAIGAVAGWGRMLPALNPMREGDVLLGLKSDGLHSNGFSFVRKIVQHSGLSYGAPAPWDDTTTVGLSLLTPTRIYVQSCLAVARKGLVLGMAHITGGGLTENVPRMLPRHLAAEIDVARWQLPPVFAWLKTAAGRISAAEFARTFNVGVGMVLVVPAKHVQVAVAELEGAGETVFHIGSLVRRKQSGCLLKNTDSWP
jgi:phosphoribosylamine--glycine ligase/phosphoribosylformylglycinamidine cyclo-ligase